MVRARSSLLLAAAASVLLAGAAAAAVVVVRAPLTGTAMAPDAVGLLKLTLRTPSKGKLMIVARHLPPAGRFDVVVQGVKVGSFPTNPAGSGKIKFHTPSHAPGAVLGFDPRGGDVVVRDEDGGDDDLVGGVPDDRDSTSGAFACCLPGHHDDGGECEEMDPTTCSDEGGTPSDLPSCLPDPCPFNPKHDTVCCTPTSSSATASEDENPNLECDEDTSAGDCADGGGMIVTAGSCDSNPCAPTPPTSVVACCVGSDGDCELLTPETCASRSGIASGTDCDSDPCSPDGGGN
jgi:hypothetical protein